jgi:monoamine oxidase
MNITKHPIIIIGAGFAGLTAAKLLSDSGYDTLVIEAKPYIGGRTRTIDINGKGIDAGATWIHLYQGNPLTKIAKAYGFDVIKDDYEPVTGWDSQTGKPIEGIEDYFERASVARTAAIEFYREKRGNLTTEDFIDQYLSEQDWTATEKYYVRFVFRVMIEMDYAAEMNEVSLSDENFLSRFEDTDNEDALIIGGYATILNKIAANLKIELSTVVEAIDYSSDVIRIQTNKGVFECEKTIITVSLGVLKNDAIQFSPQLPQVKRDAIQGLGFGWMEKIVLTFEKRFWNEDKFILYVEESENGLVFPSISDFTKEVGIPTLGIYYGPKYAKHLADCTEEEVLNEILTRLKRIFGIEYLEPTGFHISRWTNDPHFYGAYSYSNSDDSLEHIQAIATPIEDKLFFAGEATSAEGQAYVHGALLSGIREALRLGASLKGDGFNEL